MPLRTAVIFNVGNLLVIVLALLSLTNETARHLIPYMIYVNLTLQLAQDDRI